MKTLLFLLLFSGSCFAQVTVQHTNYTTTFDTIRHYPTVVVFWETKAMINCNKAVRKNTFAPDPKLLKWTDLEKYYKQVGNVIDRGHFCPAEINLCQGDNVQHECFMFGDISMQYASLNRGSWKSLETICINWAKNMDSIKIWAGNIGEIKKIGIVSVPKYCFKIVYIKRQKQFYAYLFTNSPDDSVNRNPESTVENIEQLTNLKFTL